MNFRDLGVLPHSWAKLGRCSWEKIGEVVGAPGGGGGSVAVSDRTLDGTEYDFVFDVDISDSGPPLKMGVNRGDNPYDVADRCLAASIKLTSGCCGVGCVWGLLESIWCSKLGWC